MLTALSSMAEYSQRILDLFIAKNVNKYGIYCVKLCFNGEWVAVTVDDFFPCKKDPNSDKFFPCFTKADGNELWVMILEKAYAKLYGCYLNIEGLNGPQIFADLTGAFACTYVADRIFYM